MNNKWLGEKWSQQEFLDDMARSLVYRAGWMCGRENSWQQLLPTLNSLARTEDLDENWHFDYQQLKFHCVDKLS